MLPLPLKLISQTVLGADTASVTFSSVNTAVPAGTRHIAVLVNAQGSSGNAIQIQLNGDTGSNYHKQAIEGGDASAGAARGSHTQIQDIVVSTTENQFGGGMLLFPHAFNTANHKVALYYGGKEDNVRAAVTRWANTAAITTILVKINSGNIVAGSTLELFAVDENYRVEEQALASDGTVTFSDLDGIPQEGDLVFIGYLRTDRAGKSDNVNLSINGDTTDGNYAREQLHGGSTTIAAAEGANRYIAATIGNSSGANQFGVIAGSVSAFGKTANDPHVLVLGGYHESTPGSQINLVASRRDNAQAVTSLAFNPSAGTNFKSGSLFSLYLVPKRLVAHKELEADAASVTFSNIPQTFEDLRLHVYARDQTASADEQAVQVQFNADTTAANYDVQRLEAEGGTITSAKSAASDTMLVCPGNSAGANVFGGGTVYIPAYQRSQHKHRFAISGIGHNTAGNRHVQVRVGRWENTAAITSIVVTSSGGFKAGSIFSLEALLPIGGEKLQITSEYVVEVDWNNDGDYADAGEDVTARCMGVQYRRGRDLPNPLSGRSVPGRAIIQLDNQSLDYSPANTSSPLTGNLVPGRKIRIRSVTPVPRPLWTGYIDAYQAQQDLGGNHTMVLGCIGVLGRIQRRQVRIAAQTDKRTGTLINTVLDDAALGTGTANRRIDAGRTTVTRYFTTEQQALGALRQIESSESGFLREASDGVVVYEERNHRSTGRHSTAEVTISDDPSHGEGTILYGMVQKTDPNKMIWNEFRSSVTVYGTGATATLWTMPESGSGTSGAPLLPAGESRVYWAELNPSSLGSAVAVATWIAPTATVDWNVFTDQDATGTNLNTSVAVTGTGSERTFKLTFSNTGTVAGYITHAQALGVPFNRNDPVTVTADDPTSQTSFGLKTFPRSAEAKWVPNTSEAQKWADWNLSIYKNPLAIARPSIPANRDLYHMTHCLSREISDRVNFVGTGSAGLGVNEDSFIESVVHVIQANRVHRAEFDLAPAAITSDIWIMGTSLLGTNSRLGY